MNDLKNAARKLAFYAPLKSPLHPQPSGDRKMARLLMSALQQCGYRVDLASELRTWEGEGDARRQDHLRNEGARTAEQLVQLYQERGEAPDIWFTYHVHHKAPDWVGPAVSRQLSIPYVIAEASYAPKQSNGPWHAGHDQCAKSIEFADAIFSLNQNDLPCLRPLVKSTCRVSDLHPFMNLSDIDAANNVGQPVDTYPVPAGSPRLICVAMMRNGDKLDSYRFLADVLKRLVDLEWHLLIIGDGEARGTVEECFEPMREKVTIAGTMNAESIYSMLKASDVCVWPAVNEAYGMSLLEAQACGVPVVASSVGGVSSIVEHGVTGLLAAENDQDGFCANLSRLLSDATLRRQLGYAAADKARLQHDIVTASRTLGDVIDGLGRE